MAKKYWEFWGDLYEKNIRLNIIIIFLILLVAVQGYALFKVTTRQTPIYYIPSQSVAGLAKPNDIPDSAIKAFGAYFIMNMANITPATVDAAYTAIKKYMSPRLLARSEAKMVKELPRIKNDSISSLFSIKEEGILEIKGEGRKRIYRLTLKGERVVYMGREELSKKDVTFRVEMQLVPPTEGNPYGITVVNYEQI